LNMLRPLGRADLTPLRLHALHLFLSLLELHQDFVAVAIKVFLEAVAATILHNPKFTVYRLD